MNNPTEFDSAYRIVLLFKEEPRIDAEALGKALAARLGPVRRGDDEPDGEYRFHLADPRYAGHGGRANPCLVFKLGEHEDPAILHEALAQSFDIDNGQARLAECESALSMLAVSGSDLADRTRRVMISAGLMALLERVQAELIYWPLSGQLLDPAKVRSKYSEPEQRSNPSYGFVNVRLFNALDGEMQIMDTLGLEALGLTDLQIQFQGLEKADVADLLYSVAAYLLEKGNVIDNGHTVPGLQPGESWTCLHAMSIIGPDRLVLDIDPDMGDPDLGYLD